MTIDYKKTQKDLYQPKLSPSIIDVPEMVFIMVDGYGDPNTSAEYQSAVEILYGLSYSIKMSKKNGDRPEGYFDYVVPPLEGLWWHRDGSVISDIFDKAQFAWTSMIRQPEFVTSEVFDSLKGVLAKKKPELDLSLARLEKFTEGLCAQILHIGSYDDEPATMAMLERFIAQIGMQPDFTKKRRHHEVYLNDPRKTAPEKLKTVIRYPIRRKED
ncbi:GyrI-like domain-containing protein [Parasphaerochaeta coccoides]|uniref:GyrI-like small molecule binding domain-containing protein n=1 Tax=Parasphaerochaeta coccoides (strain ATCC BAA-1237 / DSM 17374 / SPN1) TaxID=760011 RepID=F4GK23_PARC1|nr:GyrI-like domain-containing protein [Parasphaerochaeta coccoides]AEC01795.1 Protein of unknown function DUF2174 [Parasphaerochaeta coccoides DSM 17374]